MNAKFHSPTWVGLMGIGMALAAGLVFAPGGDDAAAVHAAPDDTASGTTAAAAAVAPAEASAPAVDFDRARRGTSFNVQVTDVFTRKSWEPPAPAPRPVPPAPPVAPPEPVAPPLPFAYVGKLAEEGQEPVYYIEHGPQVMTVRPGGNIGGNYQFVGQNGSELEFTYLPLNTRQTIRIKE